MLTAALVCLALQNGPVAFPFETDTPNLQPAFTGLGGAPKWSAVRDADAPSGERVLVPVEPEEADLRFVMAVAADARAADGTLWVRFRPISGKIDRAGGLVWRYRDAKNYYLARANALEDNLRIYKVVDGARIQLATEDVEVPSDRWQTLVVRFKENRHVVSLNGVAALEVEDDTFKEAGAVGIWTKADSVTRFDDLTLIPSIRADPCEAGDFSGCKTHPRARLIEALLSLGNPRSGFRPVRRILAGVIERSQKGDPALATYRAIVAGDLAAARKAAEGLRKQHPASLLARMDTPSEVIERLKDAEDWTDLLIRAAFELRARDRKTALATIESVLQLRPDCLEGLLGRARCAKSAHDTELALALHPKSIHAKINAGRVLALQDELVRAQTLLDAVLKQSPASLSALLVRGSIAWLKEEYDASLKLYDRAEKVDPEEPRVFYYRSLAWEKIGNHDRSMKQAARAAELGPELPDPLHQIGRMHTKAMSLDEAEKSFNAAIAIDERYAKSHVGLGWVDEHRGEYEKALEHYDHALMIDDSVAEGWALRGRALWKLKRVEESVADYTRAIELKEDLATAYVNRAQGYVALEKFAPALRDLEKAVELDETLTKQVGDFLKQVREKLAEDEY